MNIDLDKAKELHQKGLLADAKTAYEKLLKQNPKNAEALHGLALLYAQQTNFKEARRFLQKAIALQPDNPILYLNLANVLKSLLKFDQATQALQQALTINPNYAAALNNLGTIYFTQEKFSEAIKSYDAAIKIDDNYLESYYNLGLTYSKQKNVSAAINTYKNLLKKAPTHPAANFQLAILLLAQDKISDALDHLLIIQKYHPEHFETQTNIGTAYLKTGKFTLAKEHYLQALKLQPDDAQVLFNLGVIYMQLGNTDSAIQYYQRVIKQEPNFFAAHNNLGTAFLAKNHPGLALHHFKEALRIHPDDKAIEYTVRMLSQDKRLQTSPPEYIKNLFDAYADHYDEHLLQSLEYQIPNLLLIAIKKILPLKKNAYDILDLGCGTGLCGEILKPYAKKLIGVDLSEKMLLAAKTKNIYDELHCEELKIFLDSQRNNFDIIVAGDVLVYSGDLKDIIKSVSYALRAKGIFVFNTEISEDEDFVVTPSGRFAQNKKYIQALARQNHLSVANYEKVTTRQQLNQPVYGHLFVLEK